MTAQQKSGKLRNYYLSLDLAPGASHNDILHAYNRSKKTYSEGSLASYGLLEGASGNEILEEIEEAFVVLGNPSRRREYDLKMGFPTWSEEGPDESFPTPGAASFPMLTTLKQSVEKTDPIPVTVPEKVAAPTAVREVETQASVLPLNRTKSSFENFEPNPEFEAKIAELTEVDGAFIKAVRIYRKLTEEQLADRCKLSSSHVRAVEEEELGSTHQPVYLRGHVYLMCQALELPNPGDLAVSFVHRMRDLGKLPKKIF